MSTIRYTTKLLSSVVIINYLLQAEGIVASERVYDVYMNKALNIYNIHRKMKIDQLAFNYSFAK
jgi:hypothetical protein